MLQFKILHNLSMVFTSTFRLCLSLFSWERFRSLGVIEEVHKRSKQELDVFLKELEEIFISPDFNKREIVEAMQRFLPNFQHIERGKNLDQKM